MKGAALTRISAMFPAACLLAFLGGCASGSYAVEMNTPDKPPLHGELVIGVGPSDMFLATPAGDFSCEGSSLVAYAAPGCGSASGELRLLCSDGREITADWKMLDCSSGEGSGQDSEGREVSLLIGKERIAARDAEGSKSGKGIYTSRKLPASRRGMAIVAGVVSGNAGSNLFRIGGNYAVGFGKPDEFAYPAVFTAESDGLVIIRIDTGSNDRFPMSLVDHAETPGTSAKEGFVILPGGDETPGGVVAVNLTGGSGEAARFSSSSIKATGLPVMNAQGYVIGITALDNKGWYVFPAGRLRNYLEIVDPEVANAGATSASSEQLRGRIMTPHRD